MKDLKILDIFVHLTRQTTVSNHETDLIVFLQSMLPLSYLDTYGNLHCEIGQSQVMFVSHLDNHCESVKSVTHIISDDFIQTDGKTILGADNKAGVALMLHMIFEKVEGHYVFFKAEELGCLGSIAYKNESFKKLVNYSYCIAFDRAGTNDLVYCQNDINTASKDFAKNLCNTLYKISDRKIELLPSDRGGITDSNTFKYLIPECVNISVGYFAQHTVFEKQNITYLKNLSDSVVKVDWQNLQTFRTIPNLRQILKEEHLNATLRRETEISEIEKELGFSLY